SGEGLPEVVLIDPLMDVRLLNVTKIHLEATGFQVQTLLKESELQKPAADKRTAVCVLLDSYDKIEASWKKIQEKISNDSPYVFIVPATEKRLQEKLKLPERPEFFVDNQTLLYEPFDVSELHNALQIQSG
ncbi:MAG: hypothetical protein KAI75_03990, partial [Desulfobulbaceae bacterium]|nr:hypothetical protein [Desulfobulbaceae bacterium]